MNSKAAAAPLAINEDDQSQLEVRSASLEYSYQDIVSLDTSLDSSSLRDTTTTTATEEGGKEPKVRKEEPELPPLMLFLASSLNVELVYMILTGLTQFSRLHESPLSGESVLDYLQSDEGPNLELTEDSESSVIKIKEVTIGNVSEWSSSVQLEDYIENNRVRDKVAKMWRSESRKDSHDLLLEEISADEIKPESTKLHTNMKVTFHKRKLFMETFADYYADASVLEKSLSPDLNRE